MQKNPIKKGDGDAFDKLAESNTSDLLKIEEEKLTKDQAPVLRRALDGINESKQALSIMHGGGGTGKTHIVKIVSDKCLRIKKKVICTCPTGSGATLLIDGKTIHSALQSSSKNIGAKEIAEMRKGFSEDAALVVVDEMPMLSAKFLVLLDE